MIPFNIQFSLIIYSIIYGLFFYYIIYLCRYYLDYPNTFYRIINTLTLFLFLAMTYFIGIEIVCDGILHIYSLLVITCVSSLCNFVANRKK